MSEKNWVSSSLVADAILYLFFWLLQNFTKSMVFHKVFTHTLCLWSQFHLLCNKDETQTVLYINRNLLAWWLFDLHFWHLKAHFSYSFMYLCPGCSLYLQHVHLEHLLNSRIMHHHKPIWPRKVEENDGSYGLKKTWENEKLQSCNIQFYCILIQCWGFMSLMLIYDFGTCNCNL